MGFRQERHVGCGFKYPFSERIWRNHLYVWKWWHSWCISVPIVPLRVMYANLICTSDWRSCGLVFLDFFLISVRCEFCEWSSRYRYLDASRFVHDEIETRFAYTYAIFNYLFYKVCARRRRCQRMLLNICAISTIRFAIIVAFRYKYTS